MGAHLFKKALPHIVAILTFLVVNLVYFSPQLGGKIVQQTDIVSVAGMSEEARSFKRLSGEETLWTNSMFGGMPVYTIQSSSGGNKIGILEKIEHLGLARPIGYFNALMIGFYLLMVLLGVNPWLAIVGAVGFGLSTNNMVLFEAGHTSKLRTIYHISPVILGTLLAFRKQYLLGGILFAVGMALNLYSHHPQMTYYLALCMAIYVLIEGVNYIKKGEIVELGKIAGTLGIALLLGVLSSASYLWTTYDYGKDTMRGEPILASAAAGPTSSSSEVDGLDWQYAMQWSNGTMDLAAMLVPGAVGGSSREKISSSSAIAQDMRKKGANVPAASLYWGALPFTSGPAYMGAIFCFLFLFGAMTLKGSVKWWLVAATFLTILISLGKNFGGFNELLYNILPMYNKFRAPSSILSLTALFIPMLGILGLAEAISGKIEKEAALKALKIAAGVMGGLALFFGIVGPSVFDFSGAVDGQLQQAGWSIDAVVADRKSLMRSDGLRSFALIAISAGLIWAFLTNKIKELILIGGLGVLMLFDMWGVGKRYLDKEAFVSEKQYANNYQPRAVDQQIFAAEGIKNSAPSLERYSTSSLENIRKRGNYRVLDMSINTFENSTTSYFHNTIGGYSAAKLQRIQDMIDRHFSKGTQGAFDMLNTKYFISQQQQLQQNPGALGNAWFVESIRKVNSPNEEIDALSSITPANEAVVLDSEFNNYVNNFDPSKNGTITLNDYKPNYLSYTANSSSEQLAVFSEIWYGPNKGWNAYIDGQAADHIRANYILRALRIPAGQHKVEFKFEPANYYTGVTLSMISSLLILLAFLGYIAFSTKEYFEKMKDFKPEKVVKAKAKVAPTRSRGKKKKR